MVDGFTDEDRHQGRDPQRRATLELANQIVQEGDASPADVFLTENSPAMPVVADAGCFAPVDTATLAQVAGAVPALDRRLGRASPPARPCWSTTPSMIAEAELPDVDAWTWRSRSGRARSASRPAAPTSRRSSAPCSQLEGRGRDRGVARRA